MSLSELFVALADVFDGPHEIERFAAGMLRTSAGLASLSDLSDTSSGLPASVLEEMNRPDAHPVCALIARMPFSGPRRQHQAIRPILPTAPARFMLNCLAHKGWSRQTRSGWVCMACCRLRIMVCAPIRQKKSLSCWRARRSGGAAIPPTTRTVQESGLITRPTCLMPHGQVKTPLCLFMSGRGIFPLMVMFIPASRLTELDPCCKNCSRPLKIWQ